MERKFKIGDYVIPKIGGRFANQRSRGKQKIIKDSEISYFGEWYHWATDKGYYYLEEDIELYERKIETIKQFGIVKFCKENYV